MIIRNLFPAGSNNMHTARKNLLGWHATQGEGQKVAAGK